MGPRRLCLGLALATAVLLSACSSAATRTGAATHSRAEGAGPPSLLDRGRAAALPPPLSAQTKATLILDFVPNAVHAGIYRALAEGLYARERIRLRVVQPSETADTLSLIDAGKADFGLADGSDVATLIDRGGDAKAILAITQRPLGGLITRASERLKSPKQLEGKLVGVTGVPSDSAVLDTEVRAAGGDPRNVRTVTVGFAGGTALRAGKIAAFTGFWPADGVALAVSGERVKSFKLDAWGGPPYPGLVAFTTRKLISQHPAFVRDFVAATMRGYEETESDPAKSLKDLERLNPEVGPKVAAASLKEYLPLFDEGGAVRFGILRRARISALSSWMLKHGLIDKPIPFARYGTDKFVNGG